jgi:hypothetical protein
MEEFEKDNKIMGHSGDTAKKNYIANNNNGDK